MKNIKRVLSGMLSLAMVFTMAAPVMAYAEPVTGQLDSASAIAPEEADDTVSVIEQLVTTTTETEEGSPTPEPVAEPAADDSVMLIEETPQPTASTTPEEEDGGTLQSKVDAAIADGGELTLDTDYTESITVKGDLKLNLGEHTLKNSSEAATPVITVESGNLTITGSGTIETTVADSQKAYAIHVKGGSATVDGEGVVITNEQASARVLSLVEVESGATFTLNNGTIGGTLGVVYPAVYVKGTFNMKGGKIEHQNYAVISAQNEDSHINISGGTIKSTKFTGDAGAVVLAMNHFTMTGGQIILGDGLTGNAIISKTSDETFEDMEGLENETPVADIKISGNAIIDGDVTLDGYTIKGSANISGGTFNGNLTLAKNINAVIDNTVVEGDLSLQTAADDGCQVQITGGTYKGGLSVANHTNVIIYGGTFAASPVEDLDSDVVCVSADGMFYAGSDADVIFTDTAAGETITVVAGSVTRDDVKAGVKVRNEGDGKVVINGTEVGKDEEKTIGDASSDDNSNGSESEEPVKADLTVLRGLIKEAEEYTSPSLLVNADSFNAALKQAQDLLAKTTEVTEENEEAVIKAITDLQDALKNAKYKDANWSELEAAIAKAEAVDPNMCDDYPTLMTALSAAKYLLTQKDTMDIRDQQKINDARDVLLKAMNGLAYKGASKVALQAAIRGAEALDLRLYVDTAEFDLALATAKAWDRATTDARDQAAIDAATEALNQAIKNLKYRPADYINVWRAIEAAEAVDRTYFTETSLATLDSIIAGVNPDLDITHQAEVDKYAETIKAAVAALVYKGADLSALKTAVSEASALVPGNYSNFTAVNKWLTAAKSILAREGQLDIRNQVEIDLTCGELRTAVKALTTATANYTAVETAIKRAQSIQRNLFTADSLTAMDTAIRSVEYALDSTYQYRVDSMAQAIESAISALVYKPANKEYLTGLVQTAKNLDSKRFANFDAVNKAVLEAEALLAQNLDIRYQETLDKAADALRVALGALTKNDIVVTPNTANPQNSYPNNVPPSSNTNKPAKTADEFPYAIVITIVVISLLAVACLACFYFYRKKKGQKPSEPATEAK